jgi:hypothetical protein
MTETEASVHDSQTLDEVLDKTNTSNEVWADCAYRSVEPDARLKAKGIAAVLATAPFASASKLPTPRARGSAHASNTCLRIKRTAWAASSCAPSAWCAPA